MTERPRPPTPDAIRNLSHRAKAGQPDEEAMQSHVRAKASVNPRDLSIGICAMAAVALGLEAFAPEKLQPAAIGVLAGLSLFVGSWAERRLAVRGHLPLIADHEPDQPSDEQQNAEPIQHQAKR